MKRVNFFHCIIIMFTLQTACLSGKNMISLFIRPFPGKKEVTFEKLLKKTQILGKVSYKILKKALSKHTYEGILATYYGYVIPSNFNGHIIFLRKHQANAVEIIITQMIEPVMMIDATVHHLEVLSTIPARRYSLVRKLDEGTKTYYWDVKEEKIPKNKRISLKTIVLFANPKKILIPTGITLTTKSPHLLLPDIYARKHLNPAINALRLLKIKHFFMPVLSETKKQNDTYYSKQW